MASSTPVEVCEDLLYRPRLHVTDPCWPIGKHTGVAGSEDGHPLRRGPGPRLPSGVAQRAAARPSSGSRLSPAQSGDRHGDVAVHRFA